MGSRQRAFILVASWVLLAAIVLPSVAGQDSDPTATGYVEEVTFRGMVGCGASVATVHLRDQCAEVDDNVESRFRMRLDGGVTAITIKLTPEDRTVLEAPLCMELVSPGTGKACSDEGQVIVWEPEGEPTDDPLELDVLVRIAPGGGIAYQQEFTLNVRVDHWGGIA